MSSKNHKGRLRQLIEQASLKSQGFPVSKRLFTMVSSIIIVFCVISIVSNAMNSLSWVSMVPIVLLLLLEIVSLALTIKIKDTNRSHYVCSVVLLCFINIVAVPSVYFTNGGLKSGMLGYSLLCVAVTALLLRGKTFIVLGLLFLSIQSSCFIIEYFHPELIMPFAAWSYGNINKVCSHIMSALVIALSWKMQINAHEKETARAEQALETKDRFLANVGREIRSAMNVISGMSELALRNNTNAQLDEYLVNIKQSSTSLISLINDTLDFSKIESGMMELKHRVYSLSSLLHDLINSIRTQLIEKPLLFTINVDSTLPNYLIGDEMRLRQILINLLSNAVKYTPNDVRQGRISLSISGKKNEADKRVLMEFLVEDTGIGIKESDMPRLFQHGAQFDSQHKRELESTGLGLAISYRLCRLMSGTLAVSSIYGTGSCFTVTLPQVVQKPEPFSHVQNPEQKRVLVYETRKELLDSILFSFESLKVPHQGVSTYIDFEHELSGNQVDYRFVFVASSLFAGVEILLEVLNPGITLVIILEWSETNPMPFGKTISMPVHCHSIARVLNDEDAVTGNYDRQSSHSPPIRFTAPAARILVVDDIDTNLNVLADLLVPYEVQTDCCLSGFEAIRMIEQNWYDLVFMDHMMPVLDGIETTVKIRAMQGIGANDYIRKLPIVALTVNATFGMKEKFLESGLSDYLSKPIEIYKLHEIMARWIPENKKITISAGAQEAIGQADTPASMMIQKAIEQAGSPPSMTIQGINIERGISLTGGTEQGYLLVLNAFLRDIQKRLPYFKEASLQDEAGLLYFTAQVHEIKSAAASIGALSVSKQARLFEEAGKSGDSASITANLPLFKANLQKLADSISAFLTKRKQADAAQKSAERQAPVNARTIEELIEKVAVLKTSLEQSNIGAIDTHIKELELLCSKSIDKIAESVTFISDQVLIAEFDAAIQCAAQLLEFLEGQWNGAKN
ncbi:hybrid sensor histidine kinase/response regulator [Breznakiellaceae bacterium SP9]